MFFFKVSAKISWSEQKQLQSSIYEHLGIIHIKRPRRKYYRQGTTLQKPQNRWNGKKEKKNP